VETGFALVDQAKAYLGRVFEAVLLLAFIRLLTWPIAGGSADLTALAEG
jgi:hypothetical protein